MTDSSKTRLAYVAESTYGTTPATPAFQEMRFTSESLNANISNITSNEIRPDRNVSDTIQVDSSAGGDVGIELSYGSFDDLLEALLQGSWDTNVLINGIEDRSFTFEKMFVSEAGNQYHRFTGVKVNTLDLAIQSEQIVTGSFGMMAKGLTTDTAIITDATYVDANTNDVINAASNFVDLSMSGITAPPITSLNISITNNMRQQKAIGSIEASNVSSGQFEVTGEMVAYFNSPDLYNLFVNGIATSLSFELGGASSKKYRFEMGKLKFEAGEVVAGGNNQDVMANMSFRALFDGTDNTIKITRTP